MFVTSNGATEEEIVGSGNISCAVKEFTWLGAPVGGLPCVGAGAGVVVASDLIMLTVIADVFVVLSLLEYLAVNSMSTFML